MKLHIKKSFDSYDDLPQKNISGANKLKGTENMKRTTVILNIFSLCLIAIFYLLASFYAKTYVISFVGFLFWIVSIPLHELLHACCFKEDVYLYFDLKKGMAFAVGTENFSKLRFVWMSAFPNLIFGVLSYALFFIFPKFEFFAMFGALSLGSGVGDYMNIALALKYVPKNAKIFMSGKDTYWISRNTAQIFK